jgi:uncharacterized surface anchored protein
VSDDRISGIVLAAGDDSVDNDFDEITGSISGSVVDQTVAPISGVTITLSGTDVNGDPVSATTTTDDEGDYEFDGLIEGSYTVDETQPAGYDDGGETAGSAGGTVSDDRIADIPLGAGQDSVGNDFDEITDIIPVTGSETPLIVAFGLLFIVSGAVLLVGRELLLVRSS